MKTVKIFYDLETTGLDFNRHAIIQIAGTILVNDEVKESFNFKMKPFKGAEIDPGALKANNTTEAEINKYDEPTEAFQKFIGVLTPHINRFDRNDKAFLVGYNNAKFDDQFLRQWFEWNKDRFYGSWFYSNSIDVMPLASQYLISRRHFMPNFKLSSVANELGIIYDSDGLHDALFDVALTLRIYEVITHRLPEPAGAGDLFTYYVARGSRPYRTYKGEEPKEDSTQVSYIDYKEALKRAGLFENPDTLYDPLF